MNPRQVSMVLFLSVALTTVPGTGATAQNNNNAAAIASAHAAKVRREKDIKAALQASDEHDAEEARSAQPSPPDASATLLLHEGDPVELKLLHEVKSNSVANGEPVQYVLAKDLSADGKIVAKAGARAVGEVVMAKKTGFMDGGILIVKLNYLLVGDRKVRLHGSRQIDKGQGAFTGEAVMKEGSLVKGFVVEDTRVPPNS